MKGGKPGYFPTFDMVPHPVPFNLYDPWGVTKKFSEEKKVRPVEQRTPPRQISANSWWCAHQRRASRSQANLRLKEINNGRLAMIGLFGFLAEGSVPGSVPLLKGIVPAYSGEVMAPFTSNIFIAP